MTRKQDTYQEELYISCYCYSLTLPATVYIESEAFKKKADCGKIVLPICLSKFCVVVALFLFLMPE